MYVSALTHIHYPSPDFLNVSFGNLVPGVPQESEIDTDTNTIKKLAVPLSDLFLSEQNLPFCSDFLVVPSSGVSRRICYILQQCWIFH